MRFLAISGSLRADSSNTILLSAARILTPEAVELRLFLGLGNLPHFNPDLDRDPGPLAVERFRAHLRAADGVILSSPEYAHGVPGVLKNALDWVVRSGEFYEKPVALFNTSPRATHAQASLAETLSVMTATLVGQASISLPLMGRNVDEMWIVTNREVSVVIKSTLVLFADAIRSAADIKFNPTDRPPENEKQSDGAGV